MQEVKSIESNIFAIPIQDLTGKAEAVIFAPLSGKKIVVSNDYTLSPSEIDSLRADEKTPVGVHHLRDLRKMSILPNHKCNFNCSYCYAAQGRNNDELSIEALNCALNFFIDSKRTNRPLSVAILGGGEPLLSWQTTEATILGTRELSKQHNIDIELTVVTNASLVDDRMIDVFIENSVVVNASYELIDNVQDNHRSSSHLVKNNIAKMLDKGVYTTINSTITPDNVNLMTEMIQNAHLCFPKMEFMIFEPVISNHIFKTNIELRNFYASFIDNFGVARREAMKLGLNITCRILKSLSGCSERGCDARFNVCPNGDITSCYCSASSNDPNFDARLYGNITNGQLSINEQKFEKVCNDNVNHMEKCNDCFVRYNCAGGCMLPNDRYTEEFQNEICIFNREFVRRVLVKDLLGI